MPIPLGREDFWRFRAHDTRLRRVPYKEWHHFILFAEELCVLVNFSVDAKAARLVVMGTTGSWYGAIDLFALDDFQLDRSGTHLSCGPHRLDIVEAHYRVVVKRDDFAMDATFTPRAAPMIAREHPIGGGRRLSWLVCPMMTVRGEVRIHGTARSIENAVGYHDHNWGRFAWGDDFTWEWGIIIPEDERETWAVVVSSLQNRARTLTTLEQLLLWHEGENVLALSNDDLCIETIGRRSSHDVWTLPPVMRFAGARGHGDVPERLRITGRRDRQRIDVAFTIEDHARLVVPSQRDPLGIVTIHECLGSALVNAELAGATISARGKGALELVRNG